MTADDRGDQTAEDQDPRTSQVNRRHPQDSHLQRCFTSHLLENGVTAVRVKRLSSSAAATYRIV